MAWQEVEFDEGLGIGIGEEYRLDAEGLVLGGGCIWSSKEADVDADADVESNFNFDDEEIGGEGAGWVCGRICEAHTVWPHCSVVGEVRRDVGPHTEQARRGR